MASVEKSKPVESLSKEQLLKFDRDGFLVIPNALDSSSISDMKRSIAHLIDGFDAKTVSVFTTDEQTRKSDEYFLGSGDKIRFFFEEDAFTKEGDLRDKKHQVMNKVGHALHEKSKAFRKASLSPFVASASKQLGMKKPTVVQSMYIFKPPRVGGAVNPHQDGTFLYTEPQSCTGFWWALDECRKDNGCLYAIPGSHKAGVRQHFRRTAAGLRAGLEPSESDSAPSSAGGASSSAPAPAAAESKEAEEGKEASVPREAPPQEPLTEMVPPEAAPFSLEGAVPIECPPGTLVILHGAVVHYSERNTSSSQRHAYSIHVVEGAEGFEYPEENWLQRSDGSAFPVLGVDSPDEVPCSADEGVGADEEGKVGDAGSGSGAAAGGAAGVVSS